MPKEKKKDKKKPVEKKADEKVYRTRYDRLHPNRRGN